MRRLPTSIAVLLFNLSLVITSCGDNSTDSNGGLTDVAKANFSQWAEQNGEPYRNEMAEMLDNDGTFAHVRFVAEFRPGADATWEEREALIECRMVGASWQCAETFQFEFSAEEVARKSAEATAAAPGTATAVAVSQAEATAAVKATATAITAAQAKSMAIYATEEIFIPAGEFMMGCDNSNPAESCEENELPLHFVYVDGYSIDKYEVTNLRYQACVDAGGCTSPHEKGSSTRNFYFGNPDYADYPVNMVDFYQARDFCLWAGRRLPTEAEWEKAARGNVDTRKFPWGNADLDETLTNTTDDTMPVGSYPKGASPYGVMDMTGNVSEWVDGFYDDYIPSPHSDPMGVVTGIEKRIKRGWPLYGRIAYRSSEWHPEDGGVGDGFRCARSQ